MKCPICGTEVSNSVASCPVCGRIMEVEQSEESATTTNTSAVTNTSASDESTVFSIDGAFEPVPAEILHSDILKSVMKYNAQPKVEEEAPEVKTESVYPEQEQHTADSKSKGYAMRTDSHSNDYNQQQNMSTEGQAAIGSEAPEQKKKRHIMSKLGQFVKLRHA